MPLSGLMFSCRLHKLPMGPIVRWYIKHPLDSVMSKGILNGCNLINSPKVCCTTGDSAIVPFVHTIKQTGWMVLVAASPQLTSEAVVT
jgi:hypothetical protein